MNYKSLAKDLIKNVGGKENINSVEHCFTRLRFRLKDETKVDIDTLKKVSGVLDVIQAGGQYQVAIGPQVGDVYKEIIENTGLNTDSKSYADDNGKNNQNADEKKGAFTKFLGLISDIFQPVLGALMASGLAKALLSLLTVNGALESTDGTYIILNAIGDALFYFFPVALGWSAARRFGLKEIYGIILGAILVYPSLVSVPDGDAIYTLFAGTMFETPVRITFLKIPVIMQQAYSTTVIPIILIVYVASLIYKWLNKVLPPLSRSLIVPFITLLITAPLGLLVIGPVAVLLQDILSELISGLVNLNAGIAGLVLGTIWSFLVMFGLHWAVIPFFALNISQYGYDIINPLIYAGAPASMGAVLGVLIRAKEQSERAITVPAFISTIFGVNEPALYGVLIPRKKLLIATFLSAGVGGAIAGFSGSKMYSFASSSPFFGLPSFINPNGIDGGFIGLCISGLVAFGLALVASLVIGPKKDV